jgi:CRISPR-associated protein Csd2
MSKVISNRYEFVLLIDVENGNPNGDPDAGNLPRVDAETMHGIITDVCIKRKIRNYVEIAKENEERYAIYVTEGAVLNNQHLKAYTALDLDPKDKKSINKNRDALRDFMCNNFFDIRAFGAVMTTQIDCGQVRGPIQLNFARSIDPIIPQDITITRMAITTEKDAANKRTEMGRKHIVPYGLYRMEGYVSANLARKVTGLTEEDLTLFWEAVINMFEHDHSAARGKMAVRKLIVFKHQSELGNAPAHKLFELINVNLIDNNKPARRYNDYEVTIDRNSVPDNVELIEMV